MMIDQKQIEKSNSEKKSRQEEIKETGFKDSYGSKKHCFNNKLTENIKINSQEHSFNDGKHYSSEFLNDGQTTYKNPLKVNNNLLEENMMGTFNAFKNESNKPKKIEYFDYNAELSEKYNRFNYFLLPKYGLEEKSIQTDLSGRDIDNLKYLSEEFSSLKEEFLLNFIYNHPDVLKKLYYNALKKKETSTHLKVNIKRRINTKPHEKKSTEIKPKLIEKKKLTPTILEEKCQENETNLISKQLADEAFKRSFSDTSLIKIGSNSNLNINKNSNNPTTTFNTNPSNIMKEDPSPVSENFLNKKHLMENLLDSLDKARKDDQNLNSDSPSVSQSVSFQKKEFQQDKTFKKQISLEKKLSKIQKKQQFDPFKFFKEEYMHSHPDLDPSAIEQDALREWNEMPKDMKKIYHNIADQEKKKQKKLNKTKEADHDTNSTTKNLNN